MTSQSSPEKSALVSVRDLHAALEGGPGSPPLVVLDVRWSLGGPPGRGRYDAGHVPGARFADLETVFSGPVAPDGRGGRHPLPSPPAFEESMRTLGVSDDAPVVVYDEDGGVSAARAWWTLRYFGHDDVRFLDGGFVSWKETGLPVSEELPPFERGDFTAQAGGMPTLDADSALEIARSGVLLDVRATARYRGDEEPIDPKAGHIPGAVNAPATDNAEAGKGFHPAEVLRARFAERGVDGSVPVGAYCGSGVTAAQEVLALSLTGISAALYVGSWSDWISDPTRAIAVGDDS